MSKSIAMLAFVIAGQVSLAYAADQGRLNASADDPLIADTGAIKFCTLSAGLCSKDTNAGPYISEDVENGTIGSEPETPALTTTDSPKTLEDDEDQSRLAVNHGTGLHPTLTNNSVEFQQLLPQNQSLVHVDFSSVAGQSAPFLVRLANDERVAIYGDLQKPGQLSTVRAVTRYEGLSATYWFGQQAEPTFVVANGSVQIMFVDDVNAMSLAPTTSGDKEKLVPEQVGVSVFNVALLDSDGVLVGQQSIPDSHTDVGPRFLGVVSENPFRSIIISHTSENWMFSDLNYEIDAPAP